MYNTPLGLRVFQGAERRLFVESLATMVDDLILENEPFDSGPFDSLQRNQRISVLHTIARSLLVEEEVAPQLTATIEAAVGAVFERASDMLSLELADEVDSSAARRCGRRTLGAMAHQPRQGPVRRIRFRRFASFIAQPGDAKMLEQVVAHEDTFAIAAIFSTAIVAVVVLGSGWVVVSVVRILSRDRLKQLMIERGMSPEEIKQVVEADCELWPNRRRRRELRSESKPEPNWR